MRLQCLDCRGLDRQDKVWEGGLFIGKYAILYIRDYAGILLPFSLAPFFGAEGAGSLSLSSRTHSAHPKLLNPKPETPTP